MAIKNRDGSLYILNKPPPKMEQQSFWNKKEKIVVHNKFGQRHFRDKIEEVMEEKIQREVKLPDFPKEEIQIIKAIEETKSKPLAEDVIEVWCLPCLNYTENTDPLYDESYSKIEYGKTFIFKARLLALEDLYIQFVAEKSVELPQNSVIYPKTKNKRWWRLKAVQEVKGFNVYSAEISDYQPSFGD